MNLKKDVALKVAPDSSTPGVFLLAPGVLDVKSQAVDLSAYQGSELSWIVDVGAIASGGFLTAIPEQSDDLVTWAEIPEVELAFADTSDFKRLGVTVERVSKRYQRVAIYRSDAANSSIDMLQAFIGNLRTEPSVQSLAAGQFVSQPKSVAP